MILIAFDLVNHKGIDFNLTNVGDCKELPKLKELAKKLCMQSKVFFTRRILHTQLPELLKNSNIYISMPITEGVSASLFEALDTNCCPYYN